MMTQWQVLVPVKALNLAKSRLELVGPMRRTLAMAMLRDVVEACVQVDEVRGVTIVSADADVLDVPRTSSLRCRGEDLNEDLVTAIGATRSALPDVGIAIVVADLPALRASELRAVLDASPQDRPRFVPGGDGGTTVLILPAGVDITPAFGPDSSNRHEQLADRCDDAAFGMRCDVDSMEDLNEASRLGVGQHTVAWLREMRRAAAPMRCTI